MNILEMSDQEIGRRQSLQQLREMGIDPYPAAEYPTNAFSTEIRDEFKEDELLCVDADLAHLGLEDEATHADEVADVEQFLEDYVV